MSSHFKKNFIRMSAMNETDSISSKSIGSPSSPSSMSSASSTTSTHSNTSNQLQAAVQALLAQQQQPNMGLLTSSADQSNKSAQFGAMQQQQQLNHLLASIAAAQQQQQSSQQSTNTLLNSLMQHQLDAQSGSASSAKKSAKLNVKTKTSRSIKGNSVSPPGTSSSCSDDQEAHSPTNSDSMLVKTEPHFTNDHPESALTKPHQQKPTTKPEFEEHELDRSTNSSASQDINNQTDIMHESRHHHEDVDLEDELDDYETSFSRDPKRHRNHSTSSPTRSTSSNAHSRSTSPSTTSYHDSPAAFPSLESATAMLGGLNCTPGGGISFLDTSTDGGKKRRIGAGDSNKKIKPVPADKKDDAYWERRRKNNEAAKRSRDLRRQKEDEIAVKATVLEQENLKLKAQVTILKAELSKLHFMLYNR